ncbi:hypothetical protein [Shimia sediminis]|uniref:hypothetical protein n=1 Tax=Shimia sediminis TaxID=2497945 RepID=UPI000F8E1E11|nr:hypothetical protein [Shimia sediminis]
MALITCLACQQQISDRSEACIHCGHPLDNAESRPAPSPWENPKPTTPSNPNALHVRRDLGRLQLKAALYGYLTAAAVPLLLPWGNLVLFFASLFVRKNRGDVGALLKTGVPPVNRWWDYAMTFEGWGLVVWAVLFFLAYLLVSGIQATAAAMFTHHWTHQYIKSLPNPDEGGFVQEELTRANRAILTVVSADEKDNHIWRIYPSWLLLLPFCFAACTASLYLWK